MIDECLETVFGVKGLRKNTNISSSRSAAQTWSKGHRNREWWMGVKTKKPSSAALSTVVLPVPAGPINTRMGSSEEVFCGFGKRPSPCHCDVILLCSHFAMNSKARAAFTLMRCVSGIWKNPLCIKRKAVSITTVSEGLKPGSCFTNLLNFTSHSLTLPLSCLRSAGAALKSI